MEKKELIFQWNERLRVQVELNSIIRSQVFVVNKSARPLRLTAFKIHHFFHGNVQRCMYTLSSIFIHVFEIIHTKRETIESCWFLDSENSDGTNSFFTFNDRKYWLEILCSKIDGAEILEQIHVP